MPMKGFSATLMFAKVAKKFSHDVVLHLHKGIKII